MNTLEMIVSAGSGSRCFGAGAVTCVKGAAPSIIIVPVADSAASGCNDDGVVHTHKALVFCGLTPSCVMCITQQDADQLSGAWKKEFEAHVVVLATVPDAIAGYITCPPPTDNATPDTEAAAATAWERKNIAGLTAWAHSKEGSVILGLQSSLSASR